LNPWQETPAALAAELRRRLPVPLVPRSVDRHGFDDLRRARLIVGPRQAGKSTFVWSEWAGRPPAELLYLNCEEPRVRAWLSSAAGVLSDLGEEFPAVQTLFIEEAQNLDEAGLLVKGLVDGGRGLELFVTGSSSYHLAARTRESLAGRATRRRIFPFSLGELLAFQPHPVRAAQAEQAARLMRRQMVWGSYPSVWFSSDPRLELSDLLDAFVLRDASDRFRIQRPDAFRRLISLAAGQVGQAVKYSEWAANLGISAGTVRDYVGLLEEGWILRVVPPFSGGKRSEITGEPRVHFFDMGLRNAALDSFGEDVGLRPDSGALAEGWAFSEIEKTIPPQWTLHYWRARGGAEIDFVLARGDDIIGVEVKSGAAGAIGRSIRSFAEAYQPRAIVVAAGRQAERESLEIDGVPMLRVPLQEIAPVLREILEQGPAG
jgi:predicted AAA+ superfamily ATPase